MGKGVEDIVPAVAHLTLSLHDMLKQFFMAEFPGILFMLAISDIGQRFHLPAIAQQFNRLCGFHINHAHLFAFTQIGNSRVPFSGLDLKRNANTASPTVKPQDKAWFFFSAAVMQRIDAQAAVISPDERMGLGHEIKTRPPHQGTIAKYPPLRHAGHSSFNHQETTYHMTTTNKRPWHMFYPLAAMIFLCIAWSGYWYLAFTKAQEISEAKRKELSRAGIQLRCNHESWGGFPFRFEFQCDGATLSYRNATLKTGSALAVAQAYNPMHILVLVNGPTSLTRADMPVAGATHDDALISVTFKSNGDWDVSSDVAHVNMPQVFSSASVKFFSRGTGARIDFAGNLDELDVAGINSSHFPIDHAEFLATAIDDRSLNISSLRLSSGNVNFTGSGDVGLDMNHLLTGRLSTRTDNIDGLLVLLAPFLQMNEKDRQAVKSLLTTQGNDPNSQTQKADFTGRDGAIYFGPFKLADLEPVY